MAQANDTIPARGGSTWRPAWWTVRRMIGAVYALPTLVLVVGLFIVPLLLVGKMSASSWSLLSGDAGINFPKNYTTIARNRLFVPSVWFTVQYTVLVTVLLVGLGLGLALLVQESGRWVAMLRTVFVLPVSVGLASASLLFWGFYSPNIGPISPILQFLGLIDSPIVFLGSPLGALLSTTFVVVWKFAGFYMLILMVGLQGISDDVYEAASLDGASRGQIFWKITVPLLRPYLALALILSITGSLLAFEQFYILTKGGPDNSTVTVVQVIYREAFQRQNLGTASALSIIVLGALILLNVLQFRGLRGREAA